LSTTGPTNKKNEERKGDRNQMVGCNINGPDPKWKVYSRNRWCKKEAEPKKTEGPKEIIEPQDDQQQQQNRWCKKEAGPKETNGPQNDQQQQQNNNIEKDPTSSKTNHDTSRKLGGSGLKEIISWEERYDDDYNVVVLQSARSPTKCEIVKEAASNWDMAKYLGVKCCIQEDIMVCKMMSMEERDKGEVQSKGNSAKD